MQGANPAGVQREGARDTRRPVESQGTPLAVLLDQANARGEMIPLPIALRVVLDVLDALHEMHEGRGLGARGRPRAGINPRTIHVGADGAARLENPRRRESAGAGVWPFGAYVAPEVIDGAWCVRRADVYAVGEVLWEVVVGRGRVRGATRSHLSLRQIDPALPRAFSIVCACACAIEPQDRYPTAAQFAAELTREFGDITASREDVASFVRNARDASQATAQAEEGEQSFDEFDPLSQGAAEAVDAFTVNDTEVQPTPSFGRRPSVRPITPRPQPVWFGPPIAAPRVDPDVTIPGSALSIPPSALRDVGGEAEEEQGSSSSLPALLRASSAVRFDMDRVVTRPAPRAASAVARPRASVRVRESDGGWGSLASSVLAGVALGLALLALALR